MIGRLRGVWLTLLVGLVGCNTGTGPTAPAGNSSGAGGPAAGTKVKLALNWFPEAEHGGFYAALVHGYYREAGLDVEIIPGGPSAPVIQQVATGRNEFGVYNADGLLLARAQDAPVVALFAPLQTSPRCLMVHQSTGITGFEQLTNMTLAMNNSQPFYHYLKMQVPLSGVTVVPYQGSVAAFLLDERFGQQAYVFSEPYLAQKQGAKPQVLLVADLGFNPYTSLLITSEALSKNQPDVARRMVAASQRGWERYLKDAADSHRRIRELNPEMDLDVLDYGVKAIAPLVLTDSARLNGLGHMSLDRWQELTNQLVASEQLSPGAVEPGDAFTTEFLPRAVANSTATSE